MAHLYEKEVRARGSEFAAQIELHGIRASIDAKEIRDYMIKISVAEKSRELGKIRIYYKPSKKSFTLDLTELKEKEFGPFFESLWAGKTPVTVMTAAKKNAEYHAYVDGSFLNGRIGYGAVIVRDDEIVHEIRGSIDAAEALEQRQIPGEIEAVKKTIAWCKKQKISEVEIYFDYMGLEKWATGEWKTNNAITRKYAEYMKKTGVHVVWKKVKSHSGDKWNDHADMLAKKGSR